ncbi:S8 family peptidase [Clostridium weizhouense]|uniref:S8 family peptidase n=1 Tax=Clostridium weizhouense TaxID=2859781 RepID=A0ABS7ASD2_9CLOT|nr:S8 family peptidase [Clostridium weizhouense]MBW6410551.1 S8 family peptidase [Clostridium weizhouense]
MNSSECNLYYLEDHPNFLVEYRGNFKEQIDKVSYACGDIITKTIGIIAVPYKYLNQIIIDVPAIVFIDFRSFFILQNISPIEVGNVIEVKSNPYIQLTGKGVLIGIVDTGIDYLNQEFIREDGTSRIVNIWDQTIQNLNDKTLYIGTVYTNKEINDAINAYKNNQDPYQIVPSKDEIGHGTEMAGIMGARGYSNEVQGIANDCEFVVVKLFESSNFKKRLRENGVKDTPVYNSSEVLTAIEYLKNTALKLNKPMVIYLGVGSTEGSHDGNNLISRYLTSIASVRGLALVAGVGNEGAADGHASGYVKNIGDTKKVELNIPKEMKYFSFLIWVQKPSRMSLNVISPIGEESGFIQSKRNRTSNIDFILSKTNMIVSYHSPDQFTGHQVIELTFLDIKPGIWQFVLRGEYITQGRYDIWLPPESTLPKNTRFLTPDPFSTLTIPSTARKVVTVSYHGIIDESLVATSGRGFNTNNLINPDISTVGINILTTKNLGGTTVVSGSSAATSIVAGVCALLLQWGIVDGNDTTMYSTKLRSYLMYGANRKPIYKFPNKELGYGTLNLLKTFNVMSRKYRKNNFIEYYVGNLFIRLSEEVHFNYGK